MSSKKKRVPKFLQAMIAKRQSWPALDERILSGSELNLRQEVDDIIRSAREGISRVVGLGSLVLFSSQTGDAWMLDPENELGLCLLKDSEQQPHEIGETDERFAIRWAGRYHIEGRFFAYIPNDTPTHARVIVGYPTDVILQVVQRLRQGPDAGADS